MTIETMKVFFIMLLIVSCLGYIMVVIKEKFYLTKNIILIEKKSVTEEHLKETDIKEFKLDGVEIRSGDEVKVKLSEDQEVAGIIIGAQKRENAIFLVTYKDEIKKFKVNHIKKIKVISKYGKFF